MQRRLHGSAAGPLLISETMHAQGRQAGLAVSIEKTPELAEKKEAA